MFYTEALKLWSRGNTEELLDKFLRKFVYSSLRLDGVNITYTEVEAVFAGDNTNKLTEDYIGFCRNVLKQGEAVKLNEDNALKVAGEFYCNMYSILGGRIARMLVNYVLIANNLPPIIFWYTDEEEHDRALQDTKEMIKFLDNQAYKTWIKDYNLKLKSLKEFLD
ncbi:hypothetical protein HMPREF1982_00401 [Clostridiales bacterium oral taxon 876 str. F0540]|nr:hypothetical protein HMPREF1982_00401 [Clostridiales bacterium oral taxon 876 str. F0540]